MGVRKTLHNGWASIFGGKRGAHKGSQAETEEMNNRVSQLVEQMVTRR